MGYAEYYRLRRYLVASFDLTKPVKILRTKVPRDRHADCSKQQNGFQIRIDRTLKQDVAILFLLHEFAHILAWNLDGSDHGPNWGKCYATVYRTYLKFLESD